MLLADRDTYVYLAREVRRPFLLVALIRVPILMAIARALAAPLVIALAEDLAVLAPFLVELLV
jgi:hypothetical protein